MIGETYFAIEGAGVGVLHASDTDASTCVVLFNAGALHRSGPFRLYVALARRLARHGFPVLRLDQSGVGDAIDRASQPAVVLAALTLDRLQAVTGCRRFVVGGICSAADLGWNLALRDPRVVGLVLLDPVARRGHPAYLAGKLRLLWRRGPAGWIAFAHRWMRRGTHATTVDDSKLRDWPPVGQEAGQLQLLVDRGVEVFALYTGGAANYMVHPGQFHGGFGAASRSPRVRFLHWIECDHLFYLPGDRERLLDTLDDWLQERFKRIE